MVEINGEKIDEALTPEQLAAGAKFTELVDKRGGLDFLTQEDKDEINALKRLEADFKESDLIV